MFLMRRIAGATGFLAALTFVPASAAAQVPQLTVVTVGRWIANQLAGYLLGKTIDRMIATRFQADLSTIKSAELQSSIEVQQRILERLSNQASLSQAEARTLYYENRRELNDVLEILQRNGVVVDSLRSQVMNLDARVAAIERRPPVICARDDPTYSVPTQTSPTLTAMGRAIHSRGNAGLQAIVALKNPDASRRIAVALKAENSDGIADFWKFFPAAKAELTDDLGGEYAFENTAGLGFARDGADWNVIGPGSEIPVTFQFMGRSQRDCGRRYTLIAEFWVAYRDEANQVHRQALSVVLEGMRQQ
jgi:hypothetical protein